jgi:mannose-6-phosphate isomerase class I
VKSDCHSHDNILIDSKYFTLAYIKNHGWHNYRFLEARWLQVTVINGRGQINCFTKIKKGDNFILRSDVKNINIIGKVDLLISYIKK